MKKFKLISILTAIICLFSASPSQAQLYVGADFTNTHISYQNDGDQFLSDSYNVIGPIVGINIISGIGIEGFYKVSNDTENNSNFDSKLKSYGVDFVITLPTNEYIDFVASAGYVKNELSYEEKGQDIQLDFDGIRFGLGLQLNLNRVISLRTMYHYTALSDDRNHLDAINEFSAGIRLNF